MERNGSSVLLHFDGDIVSENKLTTRTLGKSLVHTQNAIDRAFLDLKYGNLWKYARMKSEDYDYADFIALYPEEGSFIQGLVSASHMGPAIIDRIQQALSPAVERAMAQGVDTASSMQSQFESRINQIALGIIEPKSFADAIENPDRRVVRRYGDRCINREVDQLLTILKSSHAGESSLELNLQGSRPITYSFNRTIATNFHSIVSQRELGEPVIYSCNVRQLDKIAKNGKAVNLENDRTITLHFISEDGFLKAHPFLGNNESMLFVGAPLIEYGAFDPNSGDVYFLDLL